MKYVNLTPHAIKLNDGRIFEPSGEIARVSQSFSEIVNDISHQKFGEITGLPEPKEGTIYIVSGFVLGAAKHRKDVVAPATGHPETIRNDKGHIVSVPCFTQ